MNRDRSPAWSRGVPATGAVAAEHPRLGRNYDPPRSGVNLVPNIAHGGGGGGGELDELVTRTLARFSSVLWTLRGVGALHLERRLCDGVVAIIDAAGDAGGGGDDAA